MAQYSENLTATRGVYVLKSGTEVAASEQILPITLSVTTREQDADYYFARFYFDDSVFGASKRLVSVSGGEITIESYSFSVSGLPSYLESEAAISDNEDIYKTIQRCDIQGLHPLSQLVIPGTFSAFAKVVNGKIAVERAVAAVGFTGTGELPLGGNYEGTATIEILSASSDSPPACTALWEDIVPQIGGFSPTGGAYVDRAATKTFTFNVSVENAFDGTFIGRTTVFRWRVQGSSTTHALNVFDGHSVTVPANTFPAQSVIEWRVECATVYDQSATSEWQRITTSDSAPLAPTDLSPRNVFLYNNEDNVFSWQHNSPTGTAQTKADLQISSDGATWSTLATVQGSAQQKTITAGTIGAGTKFWRVRTYNTDNVAGEWSEAAQIVLIGAPVAPAIDELITAPRAYVKWSSGDQLGWRVTFTDSAGKVFDSGEQYGDTVKEYRAEGFLADGQAHYEVAVANEYGWSSTEGDFAVTNDPSGTITLSVQEDSGEALLSWNISGTFDDLYVLRGGVPIAKVTGLTEFRDRSANGQETYQLLGTVGANYTLSNEAEVSVRVETMSIFDVAGGETVQLRLKRSEAPVVARSKASNVSYYYFAGQELPTAFTDGAASGALSISVTLRREHANELERFFGRLCCLRDKTGWRGYGVLERIGHSIDRLDDVVLDFALANYSEVIPYD